MDDLTESIERLADCIYETNQLLTQISKKIDDFMEGMADGYNELS